MSGWAGRKVLVTGHTGFKGSWLSLWLHQLGAEVTGFALAPPTTPSLFAQARLAELVGHVEGDIRDARSVEQAVEAAAPDAVFHLAAQSLVRRSYVEPAETFATNVTGTVNLLDACRRAPSVRAIVCATSDKCYRPSDGPHAETDPLGGRDPYSASKAAAELAIASMRRFFFESGAAVASVRSGNVIGGGDWAEHRLVPDIVRALEAGERPAIRHPEAVRPWLHVLDALGGYLMLAEQLLDGRREFADAWNFGPAASEEQPVRWLADRLAGPDGWNCEEGARPHEEMMLRLDSAKARAELGWIPRLGLQDALDFTADWYRQVNAGADARGASLAQLKYWAADRPHRS